MSLTPINDLPLPPGASPGVSQGREEPANAPPQSEPARHIPNLGHAAIFAGFAIMLFFFIELGLLMLGLSPVKQSGGAITVQHPMLQIAALAATYAGTLLAAWIFYPLIWRVSFLSGVRWHWATARAQAWRLLGLGLALGIMMGILSRFITPPRSLPIDQFFLSPTAAWLITIFGTLVAPMFEEIAFRGFLLPAFAIGFDWLSMPRTAEGYERWRTTTALSRGSLIFSGILTSLIFAGIHAQQVAHMGTVLLALFSISLVLTLVRIKTDSVAASAMVHAGYNGFIFLTTLIATGGFRHLERMTQ